MREEKESGFDMDMDRGIPCDRNLGDNFQIGSGISRCLFNFRTQRSSQILVKCQPTEEEAGFQHGWFGGGLIFRN